LIASVGNVLVWLVWVGAATACLASGIAVVTLTNPFFSALGLIGNLSSLAVLYLLASGAVMVMFLFVIAYLGGRADAPWAGGSKLFRIAAVVTGGALLAETLVALLWKSSRLSHSAAVGPTFGSPAEIGRSFLTDHLLAFEVTSIVLLVAAIGGVVLGIQPSPEEEPTA
jgi:NADH-quinone oxidoreductase subunit J